MNKRTIGSMILFWLFIVGHSVVFGQTDAEKAIMHTLNKPKSVVYKTVKGAELKMELYYPNPELIKENNPWMLHVHGGGWAGGNRHIIFKKPFSGTLKSLIDSGIVCVTIDYRLARGKSTAYDAVVDAKDAARFLLKNAKQFKLDEEEYGIWGGSAGGHLCLVTALGENSDFEGDPQLANFSPQFKCVASYFPFTSCLNPDIRPESIFADGTLFIRLLGGTVEEKPELARLLSPSEFLSEKSPPILLLHGDKDRTLPIINSEFLMEVAMEKNANVQLLTVKNGGHSFHGGNISPSFEEIGDSCAKFILSHLKGTRDLDVNQVDDHKTM